VLVVLVHSSMLVAEAGHSITSSDVAASNCTAMPSAGVSGLNWKRATGV
jgi:hypothetical protein